MVVRMVKRSVDWKADVMVAYLARKMETLWIEWWDIQWEHHLGNMLVDS